MFYMPPHLSWPLGGHDIILKCIFPESSSVCFIPVPSVFDGLVVGGKVTLSEGLTVVVGRIATGIH